ncbi:CDP-glycerol glycerophosphotransferase family protein [Arthrobacter rhombi]|uniref:CDP-glycerol glycerophosphotransferase family protein n=1 Tax=Arthrobacter rhombi TaxID=71253 RepID=UPI003FD2BFBD
MGETAVNFKRHKANDRQESIARGYIKGVFTPLVSYAVSAIAATLAILVAAGPGHQGIFIGLLAFALAVHVLGLWRKGGKLGYRPVIRILAAAAVAANLSSVGLSDSRPEAPYLAVLGFIGIGLPVLFEPSLRRAIALRLPFVAHLPGVPTTKQPITIDRQLLTASSIVIMAGGVLHGAGQQLWWWIAAVGVLDMFYALVFLHAVAQFRQSTLVKRNLGDGLLRLAPEFMIYTSLAEPAAHQVKMWLPYLERTGRPFVLVARTERTARDLAGVTTHPVLLCRSIEELEEVMVESMRAVFYVNASSGNSTMVRYTNLTHVFLGHGDSDKPTSYNPLHAMYDKIFAAGPAAIRRYAAHDIHIEPSKFVVVGRPQLETVIRKVRSDDSAGPQTVFFAPTWRGHVEETSLSSLAAGFEIVSALLDRGCRVIFRPHPFSYQFPEDREHISRIHERLISDSKITGREHVYGVAAETLRSITDCTNESDAMVSDVSSVVSDYLYSEKPFAMMSIGIDADRFSELYPVGAAAYVVDESLTSLSGSLDAMLGSDPLQSDRRRLRADYLGDFPLENYASNFVEAARSLIKPAGIEASPVAGAATTKVHSVGTGQSSKAGEPKKSRPTIHAANRPSKHDAETFPPSATVGALIGASPTPDGPGLRAGIPSAITFEGAASEPGQLVVSTVAAPKENLIVHLAGRIWKRDSGRTVLPVSLNVAVFTFAILGASPLFVAALGVAASATYLFQNKQATGDSTAVNRLLRAVNGARSLGVAALGIALIGRYGWTWWLAGAATFLILSIVMETSIHKAWRVSGLECRNVHGVETRGYQPIARGYATLIASVAIALCWMLAYVGSHPAMIFVVSAVPLLFSVFIFCSGLERGVRSAKLETSLPDVLESISPEFVVYFGAKTGIDYQLGMWLEYFEEMNKPFIIVTRNIVMMREIWPRTTAPVIYRKTLRSLEDVITPSLKVAFYVNNAGNNSHFIERRDLKHVWLNHGDSEKPACYNPVHNIYDFIFSAGQAGVDRYARQGVTIPHEKFRIVGRPQVREVLRPGSYQNAQGSKTVLYAPTWRGPYKDTEVYSLRHGEEIVSALLQRGCTVIFRAHVLNYQFPDDVKRINRISRLLRKNAAKTGRAHKWGRKAETRMSIVDCFNSSDAMISDVSAVVSDYLQSEKPFAVVAMKKSPTELEVELPASAAGYLLREDQSNLQLVLDELLGADSKSVLRTEMRNYYLGEFDQTEYSNQFRIASEDLINRVGPNMDSIRSVDSIAADSVL